MLGKFELCYFLTFALFSCSKTDTPEKIPATAYFPLEPGQFSEFNAERTFYNSDKSVQVKNYHYRRVTLESFQGNDGLPVFPLQYTSEKPPENWKTDSVSAAWTSIDKAFEQENGQPVFKISFPVYEGCEWNVNLFNKRDAQQCKAIDVGKPFRIGAMYFPNTVTIVRQNDSTLLSQNKYIETYALNVGLIQRLRVNLQYCYTADCLGKGIVSSGWKEISTIQKFGKQ